MLEQQSPMDQRLRGRASKQGRQEKEEKSGRKDNSKSGPERGKFIRGDIFLQSKE